MGKGRHSLVLHHLSFFPLASPYVVKPSTKGKGNYRDVADPKYKRVTTRLQIFSLFPTYNWYTRRT